MTIAAILGIDVTAQSTTPEFIPGQLGVVTDSNGTKIYKYLKYDDASAAVDGVAGEVAYYYTLDGYKNHTCTSDLSDSAQAQTLSLVPVTYTACVACISKEALHISVTYSTVRLLGTVTTGIAAPFL